MSSITHSRRCAATTTRGLPCRAWAQPGSDPPRCAAHAVSGGATKPHDPQSLHIPPSKTLRSIRDVVEDTLTMQGHLSALIEAQIGQGNLEELLQMAQLLTLHGQNAARIGRLLRDQRALSGDSADGLLEAIGKALDEISTELGVKL